MINVGVTKVSYETVTIIISGAFWQEIFKNFGLKILKVKLRWRWWWIMNVISLECLDVCFSRELF